MGTRAAFWIGNPTDLENREWLGCIAWDGNPDGLPELATVKTEQDFRAVIETYAQRDDFASPEGGWPFPWKDDIFLTDYTYAFFDGKVKKACFHLAFLDFDAEEDEAYFDGGDDPDHVNVLSGKEYDRSQPDSIMIFVKK